MFDSMYQTAPIEGRNSPSLIDKSVCWLATLTSICIITAAAITCIDYGVGSCNLLIVRIHVVLADDMLHL